MNVDRFMFKLKFQQELEKNSKTWTQERIDWVQAEAAELDQLLAPYHPPADEEI